MQPRQSEARSAFEQVERRTTPNIWREIVVKTTHDSLRAIHLMMLTPKQAATEDVVVEVSGRRGG
jgi:hypothetical protein